MLHVRLPAWQVLLRWETFAVQLLPFLLQHHWHGSRLSVIAVSHYLAPQVAKQHAKVFATGYCHRFYKLSLLVEDCMTNKTLVEMTCARMIIIPDVRTQGKPRSAQA